MMCAETGCGGTVVGGHCDVCGHAPETVAPQTQSTRTAPSDFADRSVRTARSAIVPICQCTRPPRGRDRCDTARAEEAIQPPRYWPTRRFLRRAGSAATPNATSLSGVHGTASPDPQRASAPCVARDTRSFPSYPAGNWLAGSTKCRGALHTAVSAGSIWRSTATCTTAGWYSRAC